MERKLYLLQRFSAMCLLPLVVIHLFVIFYAVRNGLSAEEILMRTRGNIVWGMFYVIFVVTAAVHAPIGMRNVLVEWTALSKSTNNWISIVLCVIFLIMGLRAVWAVFS